LTVLEDLKRFDNEDFLDWKFRLVEKKFNKETDADWQEIIDVLGLNCHVDTLRKYAYGMIEAKRHFDKKFEDLSEDDAVSEIKKQIFELRKEKQKIKDLKAEFKKFEKIEARFELLCEEIVDNLEKLQPLEVIKKIQPDEGYVALDDEKEGLALFSDWHYGGVFDNAFNKYNRDVARERITKLTIEIVKRARKEGITTLHVAQLGDIISGQIHVTSRVWSDIDAVQQTIEVTEILAEVLATLCNEFDQIHYYNVIGNHGRTITKKEDNAIKDNFEYFIVWYLKQRLKDFDNITFTEDKDGFIYTEILGNKVGLTHGNYERINNPQELINAYGVIFNLICIGHFHHNFIKEISQNTEFYINSCLSGTDEYALSIRKVSRPAQKFLVITKDGVDNVHNIKL
jgi:hypothetical protein